VDVVEWSSALDVRLSENGAAVYQWCGFKSRRGKNENVTALKSNSNTVWFNFQTYIYMERPHCKLCMYTHHLKLTENKHPFYLLQSVIYKK
jgi:hypothetical protein